LLALFLRRCPPGVVAAAYLIGYGALRLAAEPWRGDSTFISTFAGPVAVASVWSVCAIVVGGVLLVWGRRRQTRPGEVDRAA
jgi:prolipoprotein diacylglyceryltransferase